MVKAIECPAGQRAALRRAYEAAYPRECCGVLLGRLEEDRLTVDRVLGTVNGVSGVGGFAIPPHEMRRVRLISAQTGVRIVAVFHSHPSGTRGPSATDRAALAHSEWPWIILTRDATGGELVLNWVEESGP